MNDKKTSAEIAYAREIETLAKFRQLVQRDDISREEALEGMEQMSKDFDRLLSDVKLLTSVGDRLQRKLKSANMMLREQAEEIKLINENLQVTNTELKLTIDELTRARAGRKAQTYVLTVTIILFVFSELVEKLLDNYLNNSIYEQAISWGFKGMLVLAIKPLEGYIERRLVRAAMNAKSRELLDKHTTAGAAGTNGASLASPPAPQAKEAATQVTP